MAKLLLNISLRHERERQRFWRRARWYFVLLGPFVLYAWLTAPFSNVDYYMGIVACIFWALMSLSIVVASLRAN